jgi:hypothetical protein
MESKHCWYKHNTKPISIDRNMDAILDTYRCVPLCGMHYGLLPGYLHRNLSGWRKHQDAFKRGDLQRSASLGFALQHREN